MGQRLPPLNAARVFEAAARRLSFARAAEELGVTQSAVSKQTALLESYIGAQLFERSATGVALTLQGRELRHSISPAFQALSESFLRFSRRTPRTKSFRLSTIASFAAQFMVPRLDDFETALPDVALEILTSDRLLDLTREEIDLSVRYGQGHWEGLIAKPLDQGVLIPVTSPALFADCGRDAGRLMASAPRVQIFLKNEWHAWQEAGRPTPGETGPPSMLEPFLVAATEGLLASLRGSDTRLLVVGGAGSLTLPGTDGLTLAETADLPEEIRPIALAGCAQLAACQADEQVDWSYLSPPASLEPGERTGQYRRGGDELLTDEAGVSAISMEDFAVTLLDEAEQPQHHRRRFTVAY